MRLVLFDIDGTLLREGIAPKIAFARALRETYATSGPVGTFRFAGMTDPECVTEIMRQAGVADDVIHQRRDECLRRYVAYLEEEMPNHDGARLYPGVRELLERLNKLDEVLVGLLTGNVLRGAQLKLRRWNLEPYFRFGAFGDDHENRSVLAAIALEKARALAGRAFTGAETTVIGDTPKDVACARAIGARAVVVATGLVARGELAASTPDAILDSFENHEAALRAIFP
ncbi:MAG TPA: HAD family hydrolase [Candidatus Eisenbacteria bacterium]|jgi:phosphoglycolate phosphatase-like HAD superfamily hydrolase|nr:HAD family hydrolase [Candidatus Eisenbacteria bacterium]HEU4334678.1 HAD family hydrolase [Candidatus Eisenbacteria bacterium]